MFIGNRTEGNLESDTIDHWHHMLSGNNSADTGTLLRKPSSEALKESIWVKGPSILRITDWLFEPGAKVVSQLQKFLRLILTLVLIIHLRLLPKFCQSNYRTSVRQLGQIQFNF